MNTNYDIIVVGGGITGTFAAVAAGRQGKKVLLIEKGGSLGGAMVNMYVNPFMKFFIHTYAEENIINRGLFLELWHDLMEMGGTVNRTFNEEYVKILLDRKVRDAGVDVLFHGHFVAAEKDGDKLTGIRVDTRGGEFRFTAPRFIDASGDAVLAFKAGCPVKIGREEDSACQPMTLCFRMAGVDIEKFTERKPEVQQLYKQYQAEGKIKNPRENILTFLHTSEGVLHLNSTRVVGLCPVEPFDISKAEMIAREQMLELYTFLKENAPGCENATLLSSASEIGVRESRMIEGAYTITAEDLLTCKDFEDSVAVGCYCVDIHSPDGSGTTIKKIPAGQYYHIPYRALQPKGADNLLVAGRCISSTHEAQSAYRVLPIVANIGEAAGLAATLSLNQDKPLSDIDIPTLQSMLKKADLLY